MWIMWKFIFSRSPFLSVPCQVLEPCSFQACFVQRFLCFLLLEKLFMLMVLGRSEGLAVPMVPAPCPLGRGCQPRVPSAVAVHRAVPSVISAGALPKASPAGGGPSCPPGA